MEEINRSVGNSQLKNLADFIKFYNFLGANGKTMTVDELLNYKSVKFGKTNRELIRGSYDASLLKGVKIPEVGKEADLILPYTPLSIPAYAYQRDFIRTETTAIQDYKTVQTDNLPVGSTFESLATYDYGGIQNRYKKTHTKIRVILGL